MSADADALHRVLAERLDVDALGARVAAVLADPLYWFPIRHHSPAVARHLAAALRARRPRVLFLEAPAEASAMLPHVVDPRTRPPVAIYASFRADAGPKRAIWFPLLPYSPEYVAMRTAAELGCEVVFIDRACDALPGPGRERAPIASWEHLIADSDFYAHLAEAAGYRTWEEAWDAIFESGARLADREAFRAELATFCAAVRATTRPSLMAADGTIARERHMWRTIVGELARRGLADGDAMVACGGFHLFLDRGDLEPPPAPPAGTLYVTVAPYSYFRTSELAGYAAGNRAPRWYQGLFEQPAADAAAVAHIVAVLARARKDGEAVSSADAIAAAQHARLLAALRGRPQPVLDDVRDAIVTCCVKGRPDEEGAHLLRAMAAVEVGTAVGRVTPALGRLPLVHDFYLSVDELDLGEMIGKDRRLRLSLDTREPLGRRRSVFFHRLEQLAVPLAARLDAPGMGGLLFGETWQLQWSPRVEAALIDAVLLGDTVETAAVARLEAELARDEVHAGRTCARLVRALAMDLPELLARLERSAGAAIDGDPRFASLVQALTELLVLQRSTAAPGIGELIRRAFGHACFALPDVAAAPAEHHAEILAGLRAMAEALLAEPGLERALFVEMAGKARDASPVPYLRGALTGVLTEIRAESAEQLAARIAGFAAAPAEVGEFLDGVMAASRTSLLLGAGALVQSLDALLRAVAWPAFVAMLPRLRRAFEQLPERQRVSFCERVAERYGLAAGGDQLATIDVSAEAAAAIAGIDQRVAAIMEAWDL